MNSKNILNIIEIYSRLYIIFKKLLIPYILSLILYYYILQNKKLVYLFFIPLIILIIIVIIEVKIRKLSSNIEIEYINNKAVGFIDYDDKCHIGGLFVHPTYQRMGIGKKLLLKIKNKCNSFTYTTSPLLGSDKILFNTDIIKCVKNTFNKRSCTFLV